MTVTTNSRFSEWAVHFHSFTALLSSCSVVRFGARGYTGEQNRIPPLRELTTVGEGFSKLEILVNTCEKGRAGGLARWLGGEDSRVTLPRSGKAFQRYCWAWS